MEKLDRLGWADGISFISYGVRIGVRVSDSSALERLPLHLPPGWKPAPSPVVERLYSFVVGGPGSNPNVRRFNLVYANDTQIARSRESDLPFERLENDIALYVAEVARRRVFVHAGVVGWNGRAIVIPGKSRSGKSTLVTELVRAGATYYSDEYAVFDSRGRVYPYLKTLTLREGEPGNLRRISAEELGGNVGTRPLSVGMVLASEYREGANWRPRRLSSGQGAMALLASAIPVRRKPAATLAALSQAVSEATILKGPRGEAKQVVDYILEQSVI